MRIHRLVAGAVLVTALALHSSPAFSRPITLEEALAAADAGPDVEAAGVAIEIAEGNLAQADTATYNPTISLEAGPSFGPDDSAYELGFGIAQTIELGGKRRHRTRVAAAERVVAERALDAKRLAVRAEVTRAFYVAVAIQERVTVAIENESAARELADAAAARAELGAATQTEINVARAELGRATVARKAAERDLLIARTDLAAAIGAGGEELEPSGALPAFAPAPVDEDAAVADALARRPELAALAAQVEARAGEVALADSYGTPDPEFGVAWTRSAVDDIDTVVVQLSIELPVRNKQRGARRAARAAQKLATVEAELGHRQIERDVRLAVRRYRAALEGLAGFDRDVVGNLAANLALAREAMAAGKHSLLELNAVRRDLVESQLTYIDAVVEAVEARAALELALGTTLEVTP